MHACRIVSENRVAEAQREIAESSATATSKAMVRLRSELQASDERRAEEVRRLKEEMEERMAEAFGSTARSPPPPSHKTCH
eukprot:7999461-Prorocentrum_lima.AAC.1